MRFMVMVKANEESEANTAPSSDDLDAMSRYNDELVKAGVLLDANGLTSSGDGALVSFSDGEPRVIDGPFTEAKELVAGYWVLEVKSREEVVEWVKRVPFEGDEVVDIEIRQVYEADDFGPGFTEDLRDRQDALADKIAEQRG
jgi:hypothetical protein